MLVSTVFLLQTLSSYSQDEKEILLSLGFHWSEGEAEWFSDINCSGRANKAVYHTSLTGNNRIFALRITDDEGEEDYEHFENLEELKEYLK